MSRSTEKNSSGMPGKQDEKGYRHYGDGIAGEITTARLQAYNSTSLAYEDVALDNATGGLVTASSGGGGGAVTVADGADVAQGATTDLSSANTVIGILKAIKAAITGTLTVGGTVTANAGTNLNTSALALDATLTGGTQKSKLVDAAGVNTAAVSAAGRLSVDASGVAVPVTDNAGSLTVDAPVGTPAFVRLSDGAATLVGAKVSASSLPVVIASDQAAVAITPPTLTKGTQAATGFSVQDLKDSGRVNIVWTAEFAHAQTAETLLTLTESRDGAGITTASTKVVTSGKRLRITSIAMEVESLGTGTAPQRAYLRLRFNTAGAATTGSPLNGVWGLGVTSAIVKASEKESWSFPDGIEFLGDGTKQIGFSLETPDWVITTATGRTKVTITAFEY